jgi:hypothetical protein
LNCGHLTGLDLAVASGTLAKPRVWDPLLQILWKRGARHEQGFVDHLKTHGFAVTVIEGVGLNADAMAQTRAAMTSGAQIIIQGAFRTGRWGGRTDVLRRIETPSDLGAWSYEVIDTKLARETKGGTILQLCLYSELIEAVQGKRPQFSYVVAPWSDYVPQRFRMDDYTAFSGTRAGPLKVWSIPEPPTVCILSRRSTAISAAGRLGAKSGAGETIISASSPLSQASKPANCSVAASLPSPPSL